MKFIQVYSRNDNKGLFINPDQILYVEKVPIDNTQRYRILLTSNDSIYVEFKTGSEAYGFLSQL